MAPAQSWPLRFKMPDRRDIFFFLIRLKGCPSRRKKMVNKPLPIVAGAIRASWRPSICAAQDLAHELDRLFHDKVCAVNVHAADAGQLERNVRKEARAIDVPYVIGVRRLGDERRVMGETAAPKTACTEVLQPRGAAQDGVTSAVK